MARLHLTRPRACDQARALVSLRLDDDLSELEHALLDAHLDGCAVCAAFAVDVGDATTRLRGAPLVALDEPLRLPARHQHGYLRGLQTAAAGAVAAAAVVAGFIAVTPAVVGGPSEQSASTRFTEPVSPRKELQLYRSAREPGPTGIDIPL